MTSAGCRTGATRPAVPSIPDAQVQARLLLCVPFLVCGGVAIVTGGIAAAVTGPTGWQDGSWVAAYLILVVGVAQIGLGAGQALLSTRTPSLRTIRCEYTLWNGGSLLVIAGTLLAAPSVVTVGGLVIVGVLAILTHTVRTGGSDGGWPLRAFQGLLIVLLVSTTIGIALSWSGA